MLPLSPSMCHLQKKDMGNPTAARIADFHIQYSKNLHIRIYNLRTC